MSDATDICRLPISLLAEMLAVDVAVDDMAASLPRTLFVPALPIGVTPYDLGGGPSQKASHESDFVQPLNSESPCNFCHTVKKKLFVYWNEYNLKEIH